MEGPPTGFAALVGELLALLAGFIPLLFALTFIVFAWKLIDAWILHADDPGKRQEGRQTLLVGLVVITIMVSIWGIVAFIRAGFF